MGSILIHHLPSAWHVDQAILHHQEEVVVIRFGRDHDANCMLMDEMLAKVAPRVESFAAIYVVDIDKVREFNGMYELWDPCTVMFFWRNKLMLCDFGTGNNNKLNFHVGDKQELIDIIETVYRGAKKGHGLVVSPKDYSSKYNY
ncbi:4A/4B type thioredoxin-like protein [Lindgomyces ingoldianus]|uniref:4A/4B type thioredoxin-like protein n=1 Tax=Lindgomyces ingoldianus TaxID=673940 RepID=A0ACB6R3T1_9PLEO|nr:4A/4B type thioredoxin-like protein [Lindgomyces ingoldianus]KAF2473919.1 4A/4B type thioredoxin-like protein [Lindgomyces ingoldianus]